MPIPWRCHVQGPQQPDATHLYVRAYSYVRFTAATNEGSARRQAMEILGSVHGSTDLCPLCAPGCHGINLGHRHPLSRPDQCIGCNCNRRKGSAVCDISSISHPISAPEALCADLVKPPGLRYGPVALSRLFQPLAILRSAGTWSAAADRARLTSWKI